MPPPPFDAMAKLRAKGLAASYGKPKARDEGLKALITTAAGHEPACVHSTQAAQYQYRSS